MQYRRIGDVQALVRQELQAAVRAKSSRLPGFHALTREERRRLVGRWARIPARELALLDSPSVLAHNNGHAKSEAATFAGLELATNFRINGRDRLLPLAGESRELARQASRGARIARHGDGFFAGHDADSGVAWARARIPPAGLARSGRPGEAVAQALLQRIESMSADPISASAATDRAALTAEVEGAMRALVSVFGVTDRGVEGRPAVSPFGEPGAIPRARPNSRGWLDLDLSLDWVSEPFAACASDPRSSLGLALIGARLGPDVALAAASAALAVALAWLVEDEAEVAEHPPGSGGEAPLGGTTG